MAKSSALLVALVLVSGTVASAQPAPQPHRREIRFLGSPIKSLNMLKAAGAAAMPEATPKVTVQQGELAAAKVPGGPIEVQAGVTARRQWELPYRIYGVDDHGEDLDLSPMIEAEAFRPNGQAGRFAARVFIGVKNRRNLSAQTPLSPAIRMLVVAPVDTVVPRNVELAHTNEPVEVDLEAVSPSNPVHVKVIPSFDPEGTGVDVAVSRGSLSLSASPRQIQGFGLETSRITVTSAGLPNPKGTGVTLTSDKGSLEAESLTLDEQGRASTTLRSIGIGGTTIGAVAETADATAIPVTFLVPWLFLASSIAGGGAGAIIRRGLKRGAKGRRRHPAADVGIGVLTGLVIAAAYAIGINLLGLHPAATAGEALVFVISALGGYFGIPSRGEQQANAQPATT